MDRLSPSSTVCRAPVDVCDAAEQCTGASPGCPGDRVVDRGTVCRVALGACDLEEQCDGTDPRCPTDRVQPRDFVCRPPVDPICDLTERCDGVGVDCPRDEFAPVSTDCVCGKCDGAGMCLCGCSPYGEADCDMDGDCESCNVPPQVDPGPCAYFEITCGGPSFRCSADRFPIPAGEPCRGMPGVCNGMGECIVI
jgi:hypothetical protein